MGKASKLVIFLCGTLAGIAVFILAALDLLKNHLGIDTHAEVFALGSNAGNWILWAQDQFAIVLRGLARATGLSNNQGAVPIWTTALGLIGLLTAWVFSGDVMHTLAGGASDQESED